MWLRRVVLLPLVLLAPAARAAFPLTVDDAGVFAVGEGEVVLSASAARYSHEDAFATGLSLSAGLLPRLEAGLSLGYGAVRDRTDAASTRDGFLDAGVGFKASVVPEASAPVGFTLAGGVKLPTASARLGLGTGLTDATLLAITTKTWGAVSLDFNLGFLWTAVGRRGELNDDAWTAGAAVRWEATSKLMVFAETFGSLPARGGERLTGEVRAGGQWELCPKCYLGVSLGTGLGHGTHQVHATTGLTIAF
jgi:hypothetical protein